MLKRYSDSSGGTYSGPDSAGAASGIIIVTADIDLSP
jgi:hypothetical protein